MNDDATPKPPETFAGASPKPGQQFDQHEANRRSVHRHFEVWTDRLKGGWTNNDSVFPKEQPE